MSSGFNFRLQKVLDIRIDNEEKCKIEFKNAVREKDVTENKLAELQNEFTRHNVIHREESIIERKIKMNFLNALNKSIDETNYQLEEKIRKLNDKREELKIKQIERKTVEILKENKKQEFLREQNMIEQKNNDEFALYGHVRKIAERR